MGCAASSARPHCNQNQPRQQTRSFHAVPGKSLQTNEFDSASCGNSGLSSRNFPEPVSDPEFQGDARHQRRHPRQQSALPNFGACMYDDELSYMGVDIHALAKFCDSLPPISIEKVCITESKKSRTWCQRNENQNFASISSSNEECTGDARSVRPATVCVAVASHVDIRECFLALKTWSKGKLGPSAIFWLLPCCSPHLATELGDSVKIEQAKSLAIHFSNRPCNSPFSSQQDKSVNDENSSATITTTGLYTTPRPVQTPRKLALFSLPSPRAFGTASGLHVNLETNQTDRKASQQQVDDTPLVEASISRIFNFESPVVNRSALPVASSTASFRAYLSLIADMERFLCVVNDIPTFAGCMVCDQVLYVQCLAAVSSGACIQFAFEPNSRQKFLDRAMEEKGFLPRFIADVCPEVVHVFMRMNEKDLAAAFTKSFASAVLLEMENFARSQSAERFVQGHLVLDILRCHEILQNWVAGVALAKRFIKLCRQQSAPYTTQALGNYWHGFHLLQREEFLAAGIQLREADELFSCAGSHDSPEAWRCSSTIGYLYAMNGDTESALAVLHETIDYFRDAGSDCKIYLAEALERHGYALQLDHSVERALLCFEEAQELFGACLGQDHMQAISARVSVAICNKLLGRYHQSMEIFTDTIDILKKKLGEFHEESIACYTHVIDILRLSGNYNSQLGELLVQLLNVAPAGLELPSWLDIISFAEHMLLRQLFEDSLQQKLRSSLKKYELKQARTESPPLLCFS